jgi:glycosyltransferase involved in cell wall biosynthesis
MTSSIPAPRGAEPLVSIVVPVYNGAAHLRESLDSILAQSYRPIEVIVVDDASTDETAAIVASYGAAVRSFRQPANLGTFENANTGVGLARGELIAIYHADDVYDWRIVEREVEFLTTHPEAAAVFSLWIMVDQENREYDRPRTPPEVLGREVLSYPQVLEGLLRNKNRFLACPSAMVRAAVYRELGRYDQPHFGIAADLEMWLRIAQRYPLGLLEDHLFRYRHFHGNWTQRYNHLRVVPEEYFTVMDHYLEHGGRALTSSAALACHEGHRAEDRLRIAVARYIRGEAAAARAELAGIRAGTILRGTMLQRGRLLVLLFAFRLLARLPRSGVVADLFLRRWFVKRPPPPVA